MIEIILKFISQQQNLIVNILRSATIILIGVILYLVVKRSVSVLLKNKLSKQHMLIFKKGLLYFTYILLAFLVLQQFGFKLYPLIGALGVAGMAIGFAAQTSLSNIISGVFLIAEKPFEIGDLIKIGSETGIVTDIDLFAVKLTYFDNRLIRIPNETILKSTVTNITKHPIRRVDLEVGVSYKEDIRRVMAILANIAEQNPFVLDEPEPLIVFKGFGSSSLDLLLGVWIEKQNYLTVKNSVLIQIKERFEAEGIEIPFPCLSIIMP